jgi:hypothetical protein
VQAVMAIEAIKKITGNLMYLVVFERSLRWANIMISSGFLIFFVEQVL